MKIESVMNRNVFSCHAQDSASDAAAVMWDRDCGSLPVVDGEQRVVGIITDRDICMAAYMQGIPLRAISVWVAMSQDVVTCTPESSVRDVSQLMRDRRIRRVPVVGPDNRLVGIVTVNDLAKYSLSPGGSRSKEAGPTEVARTLSEICTPHAAATVRASE